MKLSIITINYNNRDGLKRTIDSVVSQSYKDYEWIVIDGGSNDGSRELIEENANHISYWCSEPDKGIYNAMNKGILKAQGEYCFFLNSGDYLIDDGALQRAFDLRFDEDVVWGYLMIEQAGNFVPGQRIKDVTFDTLLRDTIHHTGNAFIKRALFSESGYGLYDENLKIVSDWKWFLQALGLGKARGIFINVNLSVFEDGGASTQYQLMKEERAKVIAELVPESILKDYQELYDLRMTMRSAKRLSKVSYKYLVKAIGYKVFRGMFK